MGLALKYKKKAKEDIEEKKNELLDVQEKLIEKMKGMEDLKKSERMLEKMEDKLEDKKNDLMEEIKKSEQANTAPKV